MLNQPISSIAAAAGGGGERGSAPTRFDAFVDAAFAFSVSLLVIAGNEVPDSVPKLLRALQGIPAFAASFGMVVLFWSAHDTWSRRYGLQDNAARRLGLLLVFLVLVFVYPLKMMFGTFFAWISQGVLDSRFSIETVFDLQVMFYTYGVAYGLLGAVMALLHAHAWRQRASLALTPVETAAARREIWRWSFLPVFSALSCLCAALLPARPAAWQLGIPGLVYFAIGAANRLLDRFRPDPGSARS
ncbi:MAG: TMEM175 family protein [Tahibacter sp.]